MCLLLIQDCAILASVLHYFADISYRETLLLRIENISATQISSRTQSLRSICLLLSAFVGHSQCCSPASLFRPSFIAILLGQANQHLQDPKLPLNASDIARLLKSIAQAIQISWTSTKPILLPRIITMTLYRCSGLDLRGSDLCAVFEAVTELQLAVSDPKKSDPDLNVVGSGVKLGLRKLCHTRLTAVLSTLSSSHCRRMLQVLHDAQDQQTQTLSQQREPNERRNSHLLPSETHYQDICQDSELWSLLSPTEDAWIESILCYQYFNSISMRRQKMNAKYPSGDYEPTAGNEVLVNNEARSIVDAWEGLQLVGSRHRPCMNGPLRSYQLLAVHWIGQLITLYPKCTLMTPETAKNRVREVSADINLFYLPCQ